MVLSQSLPQPLFSSALLPIQASSVNQLPDQADNRIIQGESKALGWRLCRFKSFRAALPLGHGPPVWVRWVKWNSRRTTGTAKGHFPHRPQSEKLAWERQAALPWQLVWNKVLSLLCADDWFYKWNCPTFCFLLKGSQLIQSLFFWNVQSSWQVTNDKAEIINQD